MPFWLGEPAVKSAFHPQNRVYFYGISHCDHSEPSGVPRVGRDSAGESPVRRPFQAAIMLALTATSITSRRRGGYDAIRAVRVVGVRECGEVVAAPGTLPLDHTGQRFPWLGIDRSSCCLCIRYPAWPRRKPLHPFCCQRLASFFWPVPRNR